QVSTTGGPPPARAGHAAAVDTLNERMYVIGGFGAYSWGDDQGWVLDLDTHTWQALTASIDLPRLNVSLCVEDAREGVVVNKVADSSLSVTVKLSDYYADAIEDLDVTLTVHGDVLDLTGAEIRDTEAGPGQGTAVTSPSAGQYRVTDVDLVHRGNHYERQVIFDFYLPEDVYIGYVPLTVQVEVPGETARLESTGGVNILERAEALVVINRTLLYNHYGLEEVNGLLARTFEVVQGGRSNENPLGVVIYMDRYTGVGAWDNHSVDYVGDEFMINAMAWNIAAVLHSFWVRADTPEYLLIVGDDDLIPFYRTWDASEREGVHLYDCDDDGSCEHPGWCEDSDTNPAIHATDENYYFTDDFYGNMRDTEWQGGELEMVVGRLVGETAADMLTLLESGTTMERQGTGLAGLISIAGFQLGFAPVADVPDAIPNVLNVPARFSSRAFEVHNDHEWPQTIDVMEPYGWGEYEFNEFMAGGADLFGLATWANYDRLSLPDTGLNTFNVDQFRIGTDHPVFVIAGGHSALPVGPPEGAGARSVVDFLAREGASAVIGPTAGVVASGGTLDYCVKGELFVQVLFNELMSPTSGESTPLGVALRDAKRNYPTGVGNLCGPGTGEDEKIITEFLLYGVPWQTLYYPAFVPWIPPAIGAMENAAIGPLTTDAPKFPRRTVERTDSGDYSQEFSVDFPGDPGYAVTTSDGWDILTVEGTKLDASHGYPLLPSAEVFTACLPLSTTITGLEILADDQAAAGTYNIPNVLYLPEQQGGLTYTTTTTLDELYPSPVITGERRGKLFVARAMPLQHNPTTGETVFHSHFEARLTYTSPTPIAACSFRTNSRRYLPGQTLGAVALLINAGDSTVEMTPTLALRDMLTRTYALNVGSPFELAAGEARLVPITVDVPRQEGAYRAVFSAWAADGRKAIAQRRFSVLGGFLVG
ncbi:C25 family cysteine peptidase, partial [Chloroflexota bacterium]